MAWNPNGETELHLAVLKGDRNTIQRLRSLVDRPNGLGFTSLDLAKLLDKEAAREILCESKPKTVRVLRRFERQVSELNSHEFEKLFGIHYLPYLKFPSYHTLRRVRRNCPLLLRYTRLGDPNREWAEIYRNELDEATVAPLSLRWMDRIMGYGAFADWELQPGTFIGEYTGVVRRFYRLRPDHNGFCFHYPTRFFSWKYYMVDALAQGNELRFINHSDDPNLEPICLLKNGLLHLCFIAKRLIPCGAELTFDYGTDYWRQRVKVELQTSTVGVYQQTPDLTPGF